MGDSMDSNYWDQVYKKKNEHEVSWFQEVPKKSLEMIDELNLAKDSTIIDIGGGDSRLVDHLIDRGFSNITVLDISAEALVKAKNRLTNPPQGLEFVASDVTLFKPNKKFKLWHDRATFHFLTELEQVEKYLKIAYEALDEGGYLIVSTFSKSGPEKCSGLSISQYSQDDLKSLFGRYFKNIKCSEDTHTTPWNTTQNFVYCGFKKES
jgi:ubiquinone/menaquinone biosynthesis C-methylase UbiE